MTDDRFAQHAFSTLYTIQPDTFVHIPNVIQKEKQSTSKTKTINLAARYLNQKKTSIIAPIHLPHHA